MTRRNAKERPARRTRCSMLSVVETLEPRAMLAGVGPESWSTAGPTFGPLGTGPASSSGALLTCSSPTPGSSGSSSPLAPTAGTGGTQSTGLALPSNSGSGAGSSPTGSGGTNTGGLALPSNSGSGAGSSPTGSGSSNSGGLALPSNSGSGTGSSPTSSGSSNAGGLALPDNSGSASGSSSTGSSGTSSGGLALPSNSGSGSGSSSTGSGGSNSGGLALPSNSGSGADSSHSGTGSHSDPNSPVLSSQYTGGSNTGGQGSGTNNGGTLSGSDLWLLCGAGLRNGSSSSGASGGSSSNLLTLLSQYQEGSSASGQGNGTGNTLSNADLWGMYWSGAGAGSSSSGSDEGSLADDPTISAQYIGGSGVGRITPLVYNPESDGPPVFVSGVWTGDAGGWQYVNASDGEGIPPTKPDTATASVGWFDWYRNLWRSEAKPVTPQVDQPRGADIPALGLPDQLPATRPDGTIDPVFNNTVEKAAPISAAGLKGVDLEEYVRKQMGGSGNFKAPNGRDIDGMLPDGRWYEVKSAFNYLFRNGALDPRNWNAFTSQISSAAAEAAKQGKSFVLLTNIPPPAEVVAWLAKRGIPWELVK